MNTGNNATLIVPAAVAAGVLASGDELGVFSPGGILCGAAVYTGQNLALTLWGDDPATDTVEYLAANEVFGLKTWKAPTGEEPDAVFDLESGDAVYETNGIYVLAQLSEAVGVPEVRGLAGFRYFPNPAEGRLHVQFQLETAERLRLELISAGGMNVATLFDRDFPAGATGHACDVAAWPDGWYFLRLTAATGSAAYPLIVKQQ